VFAGLAGALDDAGDEVYPVLREVVAVAPLGVGVHAIGVLHCDRIDRKFVEGRTRRIGIRRNDIEPVDEAGIDLRIVVLPEMSGEGPAHFPKPQTESPADDAAKAELLSALAVEDADDQEPL
jgi:hypothetical protein